MILPFVCGPCRIYLGKTLLFRIYNRIASRADVIGKQPNLALRQFGHRLTHWYVIVPEVIPSLLLDRDMRLDSTIHTPHTHFLVHSISPVVLSTIYYRQTIVNTLFEESDSAMIPVQPIVSLYTIRPPQKSYQFVCSLSNRLRLRPVISSRFNREFSYLRFGVIVDDTVIVLDHFYFPLCSFYYTISSNNVNSLETIFKDLFK